MKMFKKEEGFTLVELMVVVLIIGILVAIAIPVFNAARERAEERSCQANLRTIDGAVQQYLADDTGNALTDLATPADLVTTDGESMLASQPECPTAEAGYTIVGGFGVCPNDPAHSYRN